MNLLDDFLTAISATEVTAPSAVFKPVSYTHLTLPTN